MTLKPFQYQFFWQKTLECTQETLSETNEKFQQAKYCIEERDFVIANQQEAGLLLITKNMFHFNFIIIMLVLFNHLNYCFAPEKVLAGTAADLRKELEATVQDVEGLFAKIGKKIYSYYCPLLPLNPLIYSSIAFPYQLAAYRKCLWTERKQQLEARNQMVVQNFQSCLTKQLQELRSSVLGGVSQQQEQLLTLENHLQSFLNFKNKVFLCSE